MGGKAQAATELIIILAVFLAVFLVILGINQDLLIGVNSQFETEKAQSALDDLSNAATLVYQEGVGAKTKVYVTIPRNVVSTTVTGELLQIELLTAHQSRKVYRTVPFQLAGGLPTEAGNYWITVEAKEGYVVIRRALVSVQPAAFNEYLPKSGSAVREIQITNLATENVTVQLATTMTTGVQLILTSGTMVLDINQNQNASFSINVLSTTPPGTYSGTIYVNANSSSATQNLTIGVTVEVYASGNDTLCSVVEGLYLFPATWDAGTLNNNKLVNKDFFVCSSYNFSKSLSLYLSKNGSTYTGFDQTGQQNTTTNVVGADSCVLQTIYINTTASQNGTYLTQFNVVNDTANLTATINFVINITEDTKPPIITLLSPDNGSTISNLDINFQYNVTDLDSGVASCSLWLNNTLNQTDTTITESATQYFTLPSLVIGSYSWNVTCIDDAPLPHTGTSQKWYFTVNVSNSYGVYPSTAYEEDYDPTWNQSFYNATDNFYLTAYDEGVQMPDYVYVDFPNLGIPTYYDISNIAFIFVHKDNPDGGTFPGTEPERHQLWCWNGASWVIIGTYPISATPDTWTTYNNDSIDETCINTVAVANQARLRIAYDPSNDPQGSIDIDFIKLIVNITTAFYVDLWEMAVDIPSPLDFSSGLNSTANTFGAGAGNDGWDWSINVYDSGGSCVVFNSATVSTNKELRITIGDSGCSPTGKGSGAYGVQFQITQAMYDAIQSGGSAKLSFDYAIDDFGLDNGNSAWIKARFGTASGMTYLGTNYGVTYDDADNEIYFVANPLDVSGSTIQIVTSLITGPGTYYLDIGGKILSWDNNEYAIFSIDNIQLRIIP